MSDPSIFGNERPVIACGKCGRQRAGVIVGEFLHGPVSHELQTSRYYVLVKCPTCFSPFLFEMIAVDVIDTSGGLLLSETNLLYPTASSILDPSVPSPIASSYAESKTCFESASYTASSLMCRRTIELICKDKKAAGGNLKEKLEKLKAIGILDPRTHEWADYVLREFGNDAAHDSDFIANKDDAKDQLDFCRAIIEHVYVFTAAFERFTERRKDIEMALFDLS
jgi:hypothetical protein